MALGFVSTSCTGFLGSYSLWMYTCSTGEGLALPTGQGALPSLKIEGVEEGVWRMWEESRRMGGESGNLDW